MDELSLDDLESDQYHEMNNNIGPIKSIHRRELNAIYHSKILYSYRIQNKIPDPIKNSFIYYSVPFFLFYNLSYTFLVSSYEVSSHYLSFDFP